MYSESTGLDNFDWTHANRDVQGNGVPLTSTVNTGGGAALLS